jgi:hypothetical protein
VTTVRRPLLDLRELSATRQTSGTAAGRLLDMSTGGKIEREERAMQIRVP